MTYSARVETEDHLLIVTVWDATGQVVDHLHYTLDPHAPTDAYEIVMILRAIGWAIEPTLSYWSAPGVLELPAVSRLSDPVLRT